MSDELKACPFCNAVLAEDKAGTRYFTHPKSDCILSQVEFDMDGAPEMVMQWNRRAQPAEEVQQDAKRYRYMMRDGETAIYVVLSHLCATDDPLKPQMDAAIDEAMAKDTP